MLLLILKRLTNKITKPNHDTFPITIETIKPKKKLIFKITFRYSLSAFNLKPVPQRHFENYKYGVINWTEGPKLFRCPNICLL